MSDFKNAEILYQKRKREGKIQRYERPIPEAGESKLRQIEMKRPTENLGEVCEQWIPEGCKTNIEAIRLGLAKPTVVCTGIVTTTCAIRKWLAAGMTVQELYKK